VYATPEDLTDYTGKPAPADAQTRLDRAADTIDDALLCAVYDTDAEGNPTAPEIIRALRRATCAQAARWIATGADADGTPPEHRSVRIGSVQLDRAPPTERARSGRDELAPHAATILRRAGLLPGTIATG